MKIETARAIGNRIRSAREAVQMTQAELAEAVGCTPQHMGVIERGIKPPKLETFIAIANVLGTSADVLLQDVLDHPIDTTAGEFAAAIAPLSPNMRFRILKSLRTFAACEE